MVEDLFDDEVTEEHAKLFAPLPTNLPITKLQMVKNWYFEGNGMLMSLETRNKYGVIQETISHELSKNNDLSMKLGSYKHFVFTYPLYGIYHHNKSLIQFK